MLTLSSLYNNVFPTLSAAENIVIPGVRGIMPGWALNQKKYKEFLVNELCQKTHIPPERWSEPAHKFTKTDCAEMVLYRTLAMNCRLIILAGISDVPDKTMHEILVEFAKQAVIAKKSILIIGRDDGIMQLLGAKIQTI